MSQGKGDKRRPGHGYENNYQKIFGNKKAVNSFQRFGTSREDSHRVHILEDIKPFKSPVTGEIISSRSQLRQHNRENGVTNSADYSGEFFKKKQNERTEAIRGNTDADRRHRIEIMREKLL